MAKKLAALLIACVLVLGCSGMADAEKSKILAWTLGLEDTKFVPALVEAYNTQSEKFELVYENALEGLAGMTDATQKQRLALETGNAPDIGCCNAGSHLQSIVESGKVLDLTTFYEEYGWFDKLPKKFVEACTIDGKIYAVPLSIDGVGMYYNKDIFEKLGLSVPQTWAEFENILTAVKDAGYYANALGLAAGWPSAYQASQYGYIAAGSEYLACMKGEKSWLESENTKLALEKYATIGREYSNPDVVAIDQDQANELFYAGMTAMTLNGSAFINVIKAADPDFEVGFFVVPPINPQSDITAFGGEGDTMFVYSEGNIEGAIDYINWWLSEDGVSAGLKIGNIVPMVLGVTFDGDGLDPLFYDIALQMQKNVDNFGSWPASYMPGYLFSDYNQFVQGMMMGELSVEQVLEKLQADRVKYNSENK